MAVVVRNAYIGACRVCRRGVSAQGGWAVRSPQGWSVYCEADLPGDDEEVLPPVPNARRSPAMPRRGYISPRPRRPR